MSITLIRILLVCCTPIGIFILMMGIKLIRAGFSGQILEEISYQQEWQNYQSSRVAIFRFGSSTRIRERPDVSADIRMDHRNLS